MKNLVRAAVVVGLAFSLSSCSFTITLHAAFIDGRLGFVAAPDAAHEPGNACLMELTVSDAAAEVWKLGTDMGYSTDCPAWMPLIYGRSPRWLRAAVPAGRLRLDTVYVLSGWQGDRLEAAFRLRRVGHLIRVENLSEADTQVLAARAAVQLREEQELQAAANAFERERQNTSEVIFQDVPLPAEQR